MAVAARYAILTAGLLLAVPAPSGGDDVTLTVWSLQSRTDRVQASQAIAGNFTAAAGTRVKTGIDGWPAIPSGESDVRRVRHWHVADRRHRTHLRRRCRRHPDGPPGRDG
jgi:hypothetical protein